MQADASRIRKRDARVRIDVALLAEDREQRRIESGSDPALAIRVGHIHGRVDRPSICSAYTVLARIGVASDLAIDLADEPWIGRQSVSDATRHLLGIGRHRLERDRASLDAWTIDLRD